MTSRQRLFWFAVSLASTLVLFGVSYAAFSLGRGDWAAFFESPARVGGIVISLVMCLPVYWCDFGGMNPGKREDRANRWIFGPILVLSVAMAVLPGYFDGRNLWVTGDSITPYLGLTLMTLGGVLRLGAVFVLGRRFTGLVAIQQDHRLQTGSLYRYIRHPSYTGLLMYMAGYMLMFRCWLGLLLVAGTFAILVVRMNAEEALLQSEFGEEYAAYRRRTCRLVPWLY
jgi:protein-S-isoprenylcysteine O-methyltransferase Ste14